MNADETITCGTDKSVPYDTVSVPTKSDKRAVDDRPYDYGFRCRQNFNMRNGQARSLQGGAAKLSSALMYGAANTVLPVSSTPGNKTLCRTNVARGNYGFVGNFDTGQPEIYVSVAAPIRL